MVEKDPKVTPSPSPSPSPTLADKPWRLVVDLIHGTDFEIAYETEDAAADAAGALASQAFIEQVRADGRRVFHPIANVKTFKVYKPRR